jgi:hypothetical protein
MRVIRNTTRLPVKVPLPAGKVLHLGPAKTGQIADQALEHAAVRRLIDDGAIELVGREDHGAFAGSEGAVVQGSTAGHHPPTVVMPKGDR